MRKLTISPRMGEASVQMLEQIVGEKFSENFREFLKENSGLSHYENIFIDKDGTRWQIQQYNMFKDLYGLTEEFLKTYKRKLIPFAYDPGRWHFCLCFDPGDDYGAIIVNRWTDHLPEEQFLKIADNFEHFIDNLKRQSEV
ncbi:MAG TPA: SMI1/KNR4 family protein [Chitinophagaceae bacterium]